MGSTVQVTPKKEFNHQKFQSITSAINVAQFSKINKSLHYSNKSTKPKIMTIVRKRPFTAWRTSKFLMRSSLTSFSVPSACFSHALILKWPFKAITLLATYVTRSCDSWSVCRWCGWWCSSCDCKYIWLKYARLECDCNASLAVRVVYLIIYIRSKCHT